MQETSKAKLVEVTDQSFVIRARLTQLSNRYSRDLTIPDDPQNFCRFARELMQLSSIEPFNIEHMKGLTTALNILPVAFQNSGKHWNLVT